MVFVFLRGAICTRYLMVWCSPLIELKATVTSRLEGLVLVVDVDSSPQAAEGLLPRTPHTSQWHKGGSDKKKTGVSGRR